ncbi:MAG TPA: OB-fold domain-containing protein [Trebonia sp.]|nr:OB-fold domain-containing protein [Trebonia sp.]
MTCGPTMLNRLPSDGPVPAPTVLTLPFWDGCSHGELLFQRCQSCADANFEPAPACRSCGSNELAWERSSGRGRLYSWVVIERPQSPHFTVPYACGIVELEEGYRMLAAVAECAAEDLADGLPLVVDFQLTDSGQRLPFFRPPGPGETPGPTADSGPAAR